MKKLLLVIAILISNMGLFAQNIGDETIIDYEGYSLRFTVTSVEQAECEVVCSTHPSSLTGIAIPSSVIISGKEFSITSIGEYAFHFCINLTSIEIPSGVTSIGNYAFHYCENLTSIEIPNPVTSIGDDAFSYCSSLTSIEIPNSVTSIEDRAFSYCDNLTSIEIPNSVTSIGNSAFSSCYNLTSITVEDGNPVYDSRNNCNAIIETETNTLISGCRNTIIPNTVTSIGNSAFQGCHTLTNIEIPNSVTSIGDYAFTNCDNLTSIEIPNSVTSIGDYAFAECSSLTSIVVESGNTVYDSRNNCNAIIATATNTLIAGCKNTVIPNTVTSIGNSAFQGCHTLTNIELPSGVTSIGNSAFHSCQFLTSINIPASVTFIGERVFNWDSNITSITVDEENTIYDSRNNCNAIIETSTNTLVAGCKETIIPNTVTSIGLAAFGGQEYITDIEIPNSVTSIEDEAFSGCFSLTSIYCYAENVPETGSSVFASCPSDMVIYVPAISVNAYKATSPWNEYTIMAMEEDEDIVVNVGDNTIVDYEGYSLKFTVTNLEPAECEVSGYSGEPTDVTIPSTVTISGKEYTVTSIEEHAFSWCSSLTSIEIPSGVTSIGEDAFSCCSSLTSIEIPSSVTSIGNWAFYGCSSLTSIEIPNSVTSIGYQAFSYCDNLTSIEIPNSVTSIGDYAFNYCYNLTSITVEDGNPVYDSRNNCNAIIETETNTLVAGCQNTVIPNSVTSIGNSAFAGCSSLTSIEIPSGVTSIGGSAFGGCSFLTSIDFGENSQLTSIGNYAFGGCSSLTSIDFGENSQLTSIGDYAFSGCSSLTNIELPSGVTSIGGSAFGSCSSLTSIELPSGVTSIGGSAFGSCSSLTSIEIPSSVTYIGYSAFSSCSTLTSIVVESGNTVYDSRDNCNAIIEIATNTLIAGCQNTVIPNSVTSIGGSAFYGCLFLTSIELPSGVTSIRNYAFYECSSLTSIEIPSGVTSIGNYAFYKCSSLTSIYCYAENVPETGSSLFNYFLSDMVIYVPAKSLDAYKAASPWNNYTIKPMGEIENHWTPDESLYANNMSVIGLIQIDSVNQNSTSLEIGAFCGEEVRGSQIVQYIPALDKYLVFLTIHGDSSDEISFRLYDHSIGEELDLRSPEAITFAVNGTLGSIANPYVLNFNNMVEITAVVNPSEAGVVTGAGIYAIHDIVTLTTTSNEGFSFKNWTVNGEVISTDLEYSFVVTEAVELVANYNYVQTRELKSGWSWFSSFIEIEGENGLEMMTNAFGANGSQIKNQTEFVVYSDGGWYGSLMVANSDMMFMLEASAPHSFTLFGPKVNPEELPITIGTNWRWLAYPLNISLSVEDALSTIVPQTGDYVKSKDAFSQYYEGIGWIGALNTMKPGEGYMYQNVSGTTKTLVYPSAPTTRSTRENVTAENNYWIPEAGKFATNMSVIAVVENNVTADYEIAAFVGDEVRGSARPIYIEALDRHMIFMTVYGNSNERIEFRYYDVNSNTVESVTSRETIIFSDNATYGSVDNAIVLTCGTTGINENDSEILNVYPNPANVNAEISLGMTYDRVEVYNTIGVKVAEYADVNRIGGIETAGVYVIKVMNGDETRNCRIVVR